MEPENYNYRFFKKFELLFYFVRSSNDYKAVKQNMTSQNSVLDPFLSFQRAVIFNWKRFRKAFGSEIFVIFAFVRALRLRKENFFF